MGNEGRSGKRGRACAARASNRSNRGGCSQPLSSTLLCLREAITLANANPGADTINFSASVFKAGSLHVITLTNGELLLSHASGATTITGPGRSVLSINANHASRVFDIAAGVTASISGVTIENGMAPDGSDSADGGGVYNRGTLTLHQSTITGNTAEDAVPAASNPARMRVSNKANRWRITSSADRSLQI